MSHLKHRKETNCLNCGTEIIDKFCHHCGQENLEPRESVLHLLKHFFEDITHFDGKFFSTMKQLMLHPGFLSQEYMNGKRASYINPIRLYLFLSFVLFLVEFSLPMVQINEQHGPQIKNSTTESKDVQVADDKPIDTLAKGIVRTEHSIELNDDAWINQVANNYGSVHEYDSIQKKLPSPQKDGWFASFMARRLIMFVNYAKQHPNTWKEDYKEIFIHSIPKMLFTSIPMFAFFLWLLYFRKRKDFYFVSHGIFTIHLYSAVFILLILCYPITHFTTDGFNISLLLFILLTTIYRFVAMKKFYKEGYIKTIFKFLILSFASTILFLSIIILFAFNTLLLLCNGV